MTRRTLFMGAAGFAAAGNLFAGQTGLGDKKLTAPPKGRVPVAFPISDAVEVIDYNGPWEVFQQALIPDDPDNARGFEMYTVGETTQPVTASGGLKIVPQYTFENAPAPKVIVIAAQADSDALQNWIRKAHASADLTMSVCTGAFLLAKTGLLAGKAATTHHGFYGQFGMKFKDVQLKRGYRFVEAGNNLATAGGLSSGIDLALRVVERYYGRVAAERTAYYMEYQGKGWMDSTGAANSAYVTKPTENAPVDPVCGMQVSSNTTLRSSFKGVTYRFCSEQCKNRFDEKPAVFLS
jgi:YHS domain-containing protein/putative intracellular protease/amidase